MLHLNDITRRLSSDSGFIKDKKDNAVYNYDIYLGKSDSILNYIESSKEEYDEYLKIQEDNIESQDNNLI